MRYGAMFPHWIGTDPAAIRDYVQGLERAGFDYLLVIDHIAGVHPSRFGPAGPPFNYTHETPTHELFTLFGFLAGVTERIELVSSVLLAPQRQTVLVAKQAAEIDMLTRGRLRLAVGIGWNYREYESLNEDFHTRGRRLEEQIEVLKLLWARPSSRSRAAGTTWTGCASTPCRRGRCRSGSAAAPRIACCAASPGTPRAGCHCFCRPSTRWKRWSDCAASCGSKGATLRPSAWT